MKNYGFFRAAAAIPTVKVADITYNAEQICSLVNEASEKEVSLVVFPELSLTGYTCGDLFGQKLLLDKTEEGVKAVIKFSRGKSLTIIVGAPVRHHGRLYNCAVVICNGNIKGIVPKIHIPNHGESYESRWFASGSDFLSSRVRNDGRLLINGKDCIREGFTAETYFAGQRCNISPNMLFEIGNVTIGVELCEDLWAPIPPSSYLALAGAQIIANLSASNEVLMKDTYLTGLLKQHSTKTTSGYIYASAGFGESSQDLVYAGAASIWENGAQLAHAERFRNEASLLIADIDTERLDTLRQKSTNFISVAPDGTKTTEYSLNYNRIPLGTSTDTSFEEQLYRHIDAHPFVPTEDTDYRCSEILSMQINALATRLAHINCKTAVIGISGGLDSTLALLVTVLAFDKLRWSRERIIGVTMPGFGTTSRTRANASDLMQALGVTSREISIAAACRQHFSDIGQDESIHDVTYENSQARERTQILMDLANISGGIVIGTGDLSELALGWATYNGDHMSMYGVNAGIPKTLIRTLVKWTAENRFNEKPEQSGRSTKEILEDIIDTPISPELLPADENGQISQVTEDLVGPYELHDFFLYNFFRFGYSPEKILFLAKKAFGISNESAAYHYDDKTIEKWLKTFLRRFFSQQFKRTCMPDGPKTGSVSLSPRGDWRMPSDASSRLFLDDLP